MHCWLCSFKWGEDWQLHFIEKDNLTAATMGFPLVCSFRAEQSGFSLAFLGVHMKMNFLFEWLGR